jgi:pentatricopeptide repeat protein
MGASFSSGREKNRWNDAKEEEDSDDEAKEEEKEEDFGDLHDLVRDKKPEDRSRSLSSSILASSKRQDVNQEDVSLCNALTCMHSECGRLAKAQEVLVRDQKLEDRSRSLSSSINASSRRQDVNQEDVFHCNALIRMHVKCGRLAKAQEVLDGVPARNVVSWNSMISGYAREGIGWKALDCLTRMRGEGISPNAVTLTSILKVCGAMQSVERGEEIHAEATKKGLSRGNVMLGTALIDMYAKCGELAAALHVSEQLPKRDVVSWTALIAGYVRHGFCDEALDCFSQMKSEGLAPNKVTFSCILRACGSRRSIELGQEIHAEVEKQGLLLEKDVVLGTALVDMYGKCGMLRKAQQVFDRLPVRNVVCWTALIAGYVQHELGDEALALFAQMQREGFAPDATTFACVLKACGNLRCIGKGEEIHGEIAEQGLLDGDFILRTALIDMYAKCGAIGKAQKAFDEVAMPKNVVCWNALIAGYVQHELAAEALRCFVRMQAMGVSPDAFTFACVLRACGQSGSTDQGREIHAGLTKQGLLGEDQVLGNALVDMYARCGLVIEAQEAFAELPAQDAVAWNVLISGYTQRGLYDQALGRFEQ